MFQEIINSSDSSSSSEQKRYSLRPREGRQSYRIWLEEKNLQDRRLDKRPRKRRKSCESVNSNNKLANVDDSTSMSTEQLEADNECSSVESQLADNVSDGTYDIITSDDTSHLTISSNQSDCIIIDDSLDSVNVNMSTPTGINTAIKSSDNQGNTDVILSINSYSDPAQEQIASSTCASITQSELSKTQSSPKSSVVGLPNLESGNNILTSPISVPIDRCVNHPLAPLKPQRFYRPVISPITPSTRANTPAFTVPRSLFSTSSLSPCRNERKTQLNECTNNSSHGLRPNVTNPASYVWKGQFECKEIPTFTSTAFILHGDFTFISE
ncbi:hypothetical protein GJ496_008679, partial [Pomphorhynchus laevis]